MKSNKSFNKRLRVTRNGKIVARAPGHNHFNARASGTATQQKRRAHNVEFSASDKSRYLPGTPSAA